MPATRQALTVTDRYRQVVIGLRDRAVRLATLTWPSVDPEDLGPSYGAWAARVGAVIVAAQRTGARASGAYLAAYLAAETGTPVRAIGVNPDDYAGVTRAGKPVIDALRLSLGLALHQVDEGAATLHEALAGALQRNVRLGGDEVLAAPRHALRDLMAADEHVEAWQRVAGPRACPVCLAAADGQRHDADELLQIHDHCTCTAEPVVAGLPDLAPRETGSQRWSALTPAQQDAAAGPGAARAIRDGAPFRSLLAHREMHEQPDQIVQRPTGALS